MAKALVCYYSRTGNTEKMAEKIAEALRKNDLEVDLKSVENAAVTDFPNYDCIIIGSPTYYGSMSWQVKKLLDAPIL